RVGARHGPGPFADRHARLRDQAPVLSRCDGGAGGRGQGRAGSGGAMKTALLIFAAVVLSSTAAKAYPTMIRHGYPQCASCHTDPSGGTLLTRYGRAQSELLLSSRWGAAKDAEPGAFSQFLFGTVKTPDPVTLGGWLREGYIWNTVDGKLVDNRQLQMRSSLAADLRLGPVRAAAEVGYASAHSAQLATITRNPDEGNLVSREHWVGITLADDAALVR